MTTEATLEQSYLILFKFLMMSKRRIHELGIEHGLTPMQTTVIFLLDTPRPMNAFKKIFNCDASNVTGLVDGLEQKQLVSRYESKTDRRIKMVQLEPSGTEMRGSLLKKLAAHDSPFFARLDPQELQIFIALIEKVTDSGDQPV